MKYLVKDTPILKNKKLYRVGDEFPYTDKDKKLLWNLIPIKVEEPKTNDLSAKSSKAEEKPPVKKKPLARKKE